MFRRSFLSYLLFAVSLSVIHNDFAMQASLRSLLCSKKAMALTATGIGLLAGGAYLIYKKWAAARVDVRPQFATFWDWKRACDPLPRFMDGQDNPGRTPLTSRELQRVIDRFWRIKKEHLNDSVRWIQDNWQDAYYGLIPSDYKNPPALLLDKDASEVYLMPFVQKKIVAAGTEKFGCSDLHGDIHSLNAYLEALQKEGILDANNPFKIVKSDVLLVFQGDYVDGGWYGAEVLYTLYRLYCENPEKVILVRGNHEDKLQNAKGGFKQELDKKYPGFDQQIVYRTYDLLPVTAYIGTENENGGSFDYDLATHAYAEIGFDPEPLFRHQTASYAFMNRRMGRYSILNRLLISKQIKDRLIGGCYWDEPKEMPAWQVGDLCSTWGDLRAVPDSQDPEKVTVSANIGASFGQQITEAILLAQSSLRHKVRMMDRGHQHVKLLPGGKELNPLFDHVCHGEYPGISVLWPHPELKYEPGRLWDGAVVTLWSSPNLPFNNLKLNDGTDTENWPCQSIARLKMNAGFANWRLKTLNIPQPQGVSSCSSTLQTATV